jgi:hypothetical protein
MRQYHAFALLPPVTGGIYGPYITPSSDVIRTRMVQAQMYTARVPVWKALQATRIVEPHATILQDTPVRG